MSLLLHGDCLEHLNGVDDNSVDLIFCDLPYGQTSCKWDCKIDLAQLWDHFMRIKKLNTPLFFTTTTKFGCDLIQSAPKKCYFRYDLVWVKSAPAGFLCAKKMPMRKHEMVYVFYEKLPFYDLSSHQHKFIKETVNKRNGKDGIDNKGMIKNRSKTEIATKYDPPLPQSVVKETQEGIYGTLPKTGAGTDAHSAQYDPPLPVSVVKEDLYGQDKEYKEKIYDDKYGKRGKNQVMYDPPLPVSVVKEPERQNKTIYGEGEGARGVKYTEDYRDKHGKKEYDPPLPVSVVKEPETGEENPNFMYEPEPEPESLDIIKKVERKSTYGDIETHDLVIGETTGQPRYEPPLPTTMLEIKSTRGKHSTEKPVALMEWILKYYSKEGDVVLDPTMGSGSTGVACKNMNRNFIGIEKDPEIYEVAVNRIEN